MVHYAKISMEKVRPKMLKILCPLAFCCAPLATGLRVQSKHVYSEVSPILFNGVYSQESMVKVAAFGSYWGVLCLKLRLIKSNTCRFIQGQPPYIHLFLQNLSIDSEQEIVFISMLYL